MRKYIDQLLSNPDNPSYKKAIIWMWRLLLGGILAGILFFIGLSFSDLPSVAELENPKTNIASLVYADDGDILGKFYTENRVPLTFEELPEHLIDALISTEDVRYYEHSGIDFYGFARAVAYMGKRGGASTITQQLATSLFTGTRSRSTMGRITQKLKEWVIAVRLERKYTKNEIIALYLNRYDFINNAKGIRAAAEIYFSKSPENLNVQESALLIGMLKNASLFNPKRFQERTLNRREVVLSQMQRYGKITQIAYDSLRKTPLDLNVSSQTHVDGLAPYFRMILAQHVKELLKRPENLKSDGTPYDIYRDGLRIYTTINPKMQEIAEQAMFRHMSKQQEVFFRHWKNKDPWTYEHGSETEIPVERREASLNRDIRLSDRYQSIRSRYLTSITKELSEATDLTFHADDREIERIIKDKEEGDVIRNLTNDDMISSRLANKYRRVQRHTKFKELKSLWTKLQSEVDDVFNKKTKMRVFDYNTETATDTIMTPLDSVRYHRMILQTGMMAVEPQTGYVRSWVGGVGFKWFQYDHVYKQTRRQVGSTIKPFIYGTTIALRGISPCQQFMDAPVTIAPGDGRFYLQKPWTPKNATGKYTNEMITLKDGLKRSKNTISVKLMKELGSPEPVRELIAQLGIDKELIPQTPSICLGAVDLSVFEMTGAYTTFANNGIFNQPVFLLRIEDRYGRQIFESVPTERQAIREEANYAMIDMLQYAIGFRGKVKGPIGGKTGTTNEHADGWFMGVTPQLVVGSWVGGDNRWISFRSLGLGQGAKMAKPMVLDYITALQNDESVKWDFNKRFYRPKGNLGIELDCEAYSNPNAPLDGEGDEFDDDNDFDINSEDDFGDR